VKKNKEVGEFYVTPTFFTPFPKKVIFINNINVIDDNKIFSGQVPQTEAQNTRKKTGTYSS